MIKQKDEIIKVDYTHCDICGIEICKEKDLNAEEKCKYIKHNSRIYVMCNKCFHDIFIGKPEVEKVIEIEIH